HEPGGAALLKAGERLPDGAPLQAGVVAHPFPDEHCALARTILVEEARIASGVEPAARLAIAHRIGLELRPFAVEKRRAPQEDRLAVSLDDERVGDVLGNAVARELEQRVNDGIGGREAAGGSGREAEAAGGAGVDGLALDRL